MEVSATLQGQYNPAYLALQATGRDVPVRVKYAGRPSMAATATGFGEVHAQEQADLIHKTLDLGCECRRGALV